MSASPRANWWYSMRWPRHIAIDRILTVRTCSRMGSPNPSAPPTAGSIGRSPHCRAAPDGSAIGAVAISQNVPLILRGEAPVISKSPQATPDVDEDLLARLADLYSKDDWFSARLSEAVQTEKMVDGAGGPAVGMTPRVRRRQAIRIGWARWRAWPSELMRSDGGPEIAVIEASGWDTHANQGGAKGILATRLAGLDKGLKSLADGLGPLWPQTAVLVVTEFGRTAAVNGTRGTDHGTGGCAFLLGGAVRGGQVIADWPGLESYGAPGKSRSEADARSAQRIQSRARRAHARRCEYPGQTSIPRQQRRAPSPRADTRLGILRGSHCHQANLHPR